MDWYVKRGKWFQRMGLLMTSLLPWESCRFWAKGSSVPVFSTGDGGRLWKVEGGGNSTFKWPVLIFPSALKWQTEKLLSPCVCAFPACRQWKYDREMLARYRQALETAVNLSVKHSLPPLPGRTLLVYLTDADADKICPKSNPEGVKKFFKWEVDRMLGPPPRGILCVDLVLTSKHA